MGTWTKFLKLLERAFAVTASLFLIFTFLGGCEKEKEGQGKSIHPGPPTKAPVVEVQTIIQKTVPIFGEYVATVDPTTGAEIVDIRARVDALLIKQHFQEGQEVRKGQVLFSLDPSTYQANLDLAKAALDKGKADLTMAVDTVVVESAKANVQSAKANLNLAVITLNRQKPLAEKKAVPQQDYDNAFANERVMEANLAVAQANLKNTILQQKVSIEQAKAEIESAKAQIATATINLGYCTVTSPIDGIAGKRLVSPGNLVGHGEATLLTNVTDLDPLRVNFNISETDYIMIMKNFIHGGKISREKLPPLELFLSDGTKYRYNGRIAITEPTIDPKTGTLNLVADFPNPQRLLRPGMFGRIRLPIAQAKNAILMPQKAIITYQNAKVVYVVDKKNIVAMRSLDLGDQVGNNVIVRKGVKAGERVIVEGMLKVHPDMEVEPTEGPVTPEKGVK
ncbi:MAG: efflux RND transporter periplasmic adaptor subunit [Candidatus Eremiobacteraeota bacterium]|nr:efflux RND transporter periplasmic adaptor subunit [Candidatus Eremiobacteraeota bacterium]